MASEERDPGMDETLSPDDALRTQAAGATGEETLDVDALEVGVALTLAPSEPEEMSAPEDAGEALREVNPERYLRGDELARGGMGRIVLAEDQRLRRPVALKEMLSTRRDAALLRFEREALITARLQHPGIVSVQDAGRWPSGEAFYAMEMVRGRDFDAVISELSELDERIAQLPVLIDVADAIAYAHSRGVVHRDLKPANVLVGAFGETIVIDWGIARLLSAPDVEDEGEDAAPKLEEELGDAELTQQGSIIGTLTYMAPEQAEGEAVDERADVYAIGAMIYHLLSGEPPHTADTGIQLLWKVINKAPAPLRERVPGVPEALQSIVERAMARDLSERYRDAGELAEELRRFAGGQLVASHHYSLSELVRRFIRRHRGAVITAAASVVILTVVVGLFMTRLLQANAETRQANTELSAINADLEATNDALAAEKQAARKAADAMIEAAVFRAALGDPLEAVELFDFFRELYQEDTTLELELQRRAAQTLEDAGEHALAAERFRALIPASSGPQRHAFTASLARNLWEIGAREEALERYRSLLDLTPTDANREAVAEAHFMNAEASSREVLDGLQAVQDPGGLEALRPRLRRSVGLYEQAREVGSPRWGLAAMVRQGDILHDFAEAVQRMPVPEELTEEERVAYEDVLLDTALPLLDRAVANYEAVDKASHERRLFTPYTRRAQRRLHQMRPQRWRFDLLLERSTVADLYGLELREGASERVQELVNLRRFNAARALLDEQIRARPEDVSLRYNFAFAVLRESPATSDVFLKRGLLNTAVEYLQRVLSKNPRDVEARTLLALIYTRLERYELALLLLERAQESLSTGEVPAFVPNALGLVYQARGQAAQALEAFERSGSEEALANMGALLISLRDFKAARAIYERLLEEAPERASARLGIAITQLGEGKTEEGTQALRALLYDAPEETLAFFALGLALEKQNTLEQALDAHLAFVEEDASRFYPAQLERARKHAADLADRIAMRDAVASQKAPTSALTREQIRDTIQSYSDESRACWQRALDEGRQVRSTARVALRFVIDPTGRVRAVSSEYDDGTSPFLAECLVNSARGWSFPEPASGGTVQVAYPLNFSTR